MCFVKYVSSTLATLLDRVAMPNAPVEAMKEEIGNKEFDFMSEDLQTLSDYAVKSVKVILESKGAALLDRKVITEEEREDFHRLCRRRRLEVDLELISWYFTPMSNVLKRGLGEGNDRRETNANCLADFLNAYQPMREAHARLRIENFRPEALMGTVQNAIDTQRERSFGKFMDDV